MPYKHTQTERAIADRRRKNISTIWTGAKTLGWTKEQFYENMAAWGYGTSVSALTERQQIAVIELLRKAGFAPARRGRGHQPDARKNAPPAHIDAGVPDDFRPAKYYIRDDEEPQVAKIMMMWTHLHELGAVRSPSLRSLNAYVKRMTKKSHVRWLTGADCNKVIEALKAWTARAESEAVKK